MRAYKRSVEDQFRLTDRLWISIGIVLVAVNLRPGMTSVGPLVGMIREDLSLANWSVGLLTSLPLLAFALVSPIVPKISKQLTDEWTMILGLAIIIFGISVRSHSYTALLFLGTFFVGLGIAICNVLLPGVVKNKFPTEVAFMTGVYSTIMGIFAALASGLSVPIAKGLKGGWERSLLVWTIPAITGVILWVYLARKNKTPHELHTDPNPTNHGQIWRSPIAWQVAFFMGLQSSLFYVSITWLPEILQYKGLHISTAGWMLSYTQFIGMPASFMIPLMAGRLKSQRILVLVLGLSAILGLLGLLMSRELITMLISITLLGITLGGCFALALTFLAIRAKTAKDANELSGMAQSIGYLLAASGPVLIGFIHDVTGDWQIPLFLLIGITILIIIFGMGAGQDEYVLD